MTDGTDHNLGVDAPPQTYRVIICGSRSIGELYRSRIYRHLDRLLAGWRQGMPAHRIIVISGTARGVDRMGEDWARVNGLTVEQYKADWGKHGNRAGYLRNEWMADVANGVVAFWDGFSKGTDHMIRTALAQGLDTHEFSFGFIEPGPPAGLFEDREGEEGAEV